MVTPDVEKFLRRAAAAATLLAAFSQGALGTPTVDPARSVECGPLVLEIAATETSHLFHVVDQLSNWSEFCHGQYRRRMPLDDGDEAVLAGYAGVRKAVGWNRGLEDLFHLAGPEDDPVAQAVERKLLDGAGAARVRRALDRFRERVRAMFAAGEKELRATMDGVDPATVAPVARKVARLCGVERVVVPVRLVVSPGGGGGGGYYGKTLAVETDGGRSVLSTLVHESFHAILARRRADLEKSAAATPGLDFTTLNEGLAYAIAPGLVRTDGEDRLARQAASFRAAGRGLEESYPRFTLYGLALRPVLQEALDDDTATLEGLLDRARAVWTALEEREASAARDPDAPPRALCAGPGWEAFQERVRKEGAFELGMCFNHRADHYAKHLRRLGRVDLFALLVAGDHGDRRIPDAWRDLSPVPVEEVDARLAAGKTVEAAGEARGFRVVLLAAPTKAGLENLVRRTKLLSK